MLFVTDDNTLRYDISTQTCYLMLWLWFNRNDLLIVVTIRIPRKQLLLLKCYIFICKIFTWNKNGCVLLFRTERTFIINNVKQIRNYFVNFEENIFFDSNQCWHIVKLKWDFRILMLVAMMRWSCSNFEMSFDICVKKRNWMTERNCRESSLCGIYLML